jgi:predicted acetyltransferase
MAAAKIASIVRAVSEMTKPKGAYDLLIRLRDLPMTSPYYEAAQAAEEKINKLEREEARLLKLKEAFQREITDINDQLEGEA